ncbi:Phospho-2-dehydro-3-deoxyheptonate aldolase 1, chloroplastic [Coccomyxa sp. Obi]|nr:Phospho-2-dehydro-3-deoxyheptonate aldolase 1, chloroplastic [Coccomyxa sp. Obi]
MSFPRHQTRAILRQQSLRPVAQPVSLPFQRESEHLTAWTPESWRQFQAHQQPNYTDVQKVTDALETISRLPALVFAGECRNLQSRLAKCATGEAFLVQGGDCAESFSQFSANRIRDSFRVQLQMALVAMFGGGVPVVKVGRMAGQFAKPRSSDTETFDGVELPSGDIINGQEFTAEARVPDPARMVQAYNQSAATLNLLRGFATGGYASLQRVMKWNLGFMDNSDKGEAYLEVAKRVDEAIAFMVACGLDENTPIMNETEYYVSHEALLLPYEQALTREDSTTGLWYDCSGHLLWCGERTRQLDGAHVEFMRGIGNPIGVKVSDKMDGGQLVSLVAALNPGNVPGRLTVIVRMGSDKVRVNLPRLIEAVRDSGQVVTWVCDPMHGNTECVAGFKTRRFERIRSEVEAFFDVHEELGSVPGGIHLEMTGDDVTECLGGGASIDEGDLDSRYHTHCDPRLNAEQALEMAFYVASRLAERKETMCRLSASPAAPIF